jgi:hypothetical protein
MDAQLPRCVKLRKARCEQMFSGFPLKADLAQFSRHFAFVPTTVMRKKEKPHPGCYRQGPENRWMVASVGVNPRLTEPWGIACRGCNAGSARQTIRSSTSLKRCVSERGIPRGDDLVRAMRGRGRAWQVHGVVVCVAFSEWRRAPAAIGDGQKEAANQGWRGCRTSAF